VPGARYIRIVAEPLRRVPYGREIRFCGVTPGNDDAPPAFPGRRGIGSESGTDGRRPIIRQAMPISRSISATSPPHATRHKPNGHEGQNRRQRKTVTTPGQPDSLRLERPDPCSTPRKEAKVSWLCIDCRAGDPVRINNLNPKSPVRSPPNDMPGHSTALPCIRKAVTDYLDAVVISPVHTSAAWIAMSPPYACRPLPGTGIAELFQHLPELTDGQGAPRVVEEHAPGIGNNARIKIWRSRVI
jgi:hypothetical protein